jgi:hypothetical protein
MQSRSVTRIETGVDRGASALFAIACGYAAYGWFAHHVAPIRLAAQTLATFVFAYFLAARVLGSVKPEVEKIPIPVFDIRAVDDFEDFERTRSRFHGANRVATVEEELEPLVLDVPVDEFANREGPGLRLIEAGEAVDERLEGSDPEASAAAAESELDQGYGPNLAESDRLVSLENDSDPLLLEDKLVEPTSDSRVVRLFDSAAMPRGATDDRLEPLPMDALSIEPGDASQALHEALAELRRSLR